MQGEILGMAHHPCVVLTPLSLLCKPDNGNDKFYKSDNLVKNEGYFLSFSHPMTFL